MVEITGLEPARVASLDPKSSASASFAISPNKWCLQTDLNHQPTDYKSVALPIEL